MHTNFIQLQTTHTLPNSLILQTYGYSLVFFIDCRPFVLLNSATTNDRTCPISLTPIYPIRSLLGRRSHEPHRRHQHCSSSTLALHLVNRRHFLRAQHNRRPLAMRINSRFPRLRTRHYMRSRRFSFLRVRCRRKIKTRSMPCNDHRRECVDSHRVSREIFKRNKAVFII
jgi:hypothetical protein